MMTTENPIYWQDEILQILFWMRGEGLGEVVALEEINRLLTIEKSNLNEAVERLEEMGHLKLSTNSENISEVQLTEQGKKEGKIRFKDEFENYLGHEDHMVCDDPNCDCHAENIEGTCKHFSLEQGHQH
jgi:Mn-dependent DtxR family transcriptional regulator